MFDMLTSGYNAAKKNGIIKRPQNINYKYIYIYIYILNI